MMHTLSLLSQQLCLTIYCQTLTSSLAYFFFISKGYCCVLHTITMLHHSLVGTSKAFTTSTRLKPEVLHLVFYFLYLFLIIFLLFFPVVCYFFFLFCWFHVKMCLTKCRCEKLWYKCVLKTHLFTYSLKYDLYSDIWFV